MKKVAAVAGVIVLIAVAVLYRIGTTKPDRPEIVSGPLAISAHDSSIDIPVAVSLERIRATLEESMPKSLRGERGVNVPGNVDQEKLSWNATRGVIGVKGIEGGLELTTTIEGGATVRARICPAGERGPCGSFRESVELAANVAIKIGNVGLTRDWKLSAAASTVVDVTKAKGKLLEFIPYSFETDLEDGIASVMPAMQQAFGDHLAQLKIREQLESAWANTHHILKVSANPAVWVVLEPKAAAIAPMTVADGQVHTAARLVASVRTVIGIEPTDAKGPFPQLVDMPGAPPAFEIRVPIIASLDALTQQANHCCLPVIVQAGSKTLEIKRVKLAESRNKLIVEARFSTGWFGAHGTLFLEGTPRLSADRNMLEVAGLAYDLRTQQVLLDGAAELAQPAVLDAIAKELRIDLKTLSESALEQIRARASNLTIAGVDVKIDTIGVGLEDVQVGDGKLAIIVAATGSVRVAVK